MTVPSQQPSNAYCSSAGNGIPRPLPFSVLSLMSSCRPCTHDHKCCDFMCAAALLCLGNTVSLVLSTTSSSYNPSVFPTPSHLGSFSMYMFVLLYVHGYGDHGYGDRRLMSRLVSNHSSVFVISEAWSVHPNHRWSVWLVLLTLVSSGDLISSTFGA